MFFRSFGINLLLPNHQLLLLLGSLCSKSKPSSSLCCTSCYFTRCCQDGDKCLVTTDEMTIRMSDHDVFTFTDLVLQLEARSSKVDQVRLVGWLVELHVFVKVGWVDLVLYLPCFKPSSHKFMQSGAYCLLY